MSNMRKGWYVPTTEEVCDGFRGNPRKFEQAGEPIDAIGSNYGPKCYAAFNRWLAAHDAQIRESARHLMLKDGEITAFAKTMFEALGTYGLFACEHDDWREAFDDAFVNAENGRYGLNAVEAGIKAINAKREEA